VERGRGVGTVMRRWDPPRHRSTVITDGGADTPDLRFGIVEEAVAGLEICWRRSSEKEEGGDGGREGGGVVEAAWQHGGRRPTGLTYDMLVPSLLTYWFVPMFDHLR
jgi:hypothetical protein